MDQHSCAIGDHMRGDVILFGNYFQSLCMVGMLMRNENCIDIGKRRADGVQIFFDGTRADTRVNQNLRIGSSDINAVAGGTGVKGICGDISHGIPSKRREDERKAL